MTWEEEDKAGRVLRVLPANDGLPPRLVTKDPMAAEEGAALFALEGIDLPGLCAAMFGACGQPVPVITPRPDVDTAGSLEVGPWMLAVTRDRTVGLARTDAPGRALAPYEARRLAGLLVAYADAAESEPDPAEVDALAAVLADPSVMGMQAYRPAARRALLAGWKREGNGNA